MASRKTTKPDFEWRSFNPGRLLSAALHRFEGRVLECIAEDGYAQTRRPHVNLTRHLDLEGTRITELARRAGMTNAAMTELIDQCEALGLVERLADTADKRARVVFFTEFGLMWLDAFGRAVRRATSEMAQDIGREELAVLLAGLMRYAAPEQESDPAPAARTPAQKG